MAFLPLRIQINRPQVYSVLISMLYFDTRGHQYYHLY